MARRSPTPHHNDWGRYATPADLPNVAASPTQDPNLEVGDTATAGTSKYACTDDTPGAAVWVSQGGGGSGGPELIFQWNGVDLSQFGAVVDHARSGGIASGTMTPTVVPDPLYSGRNVIQMAGNLEGGFCLPISGLVLPEQFRISMEIDPGTAVNNVYVGALCFAVVAGQVQGISVGPRMAASANLYTGAVVNDVGGAGGDIIANSNAGFVPNAAGRRMRLSSQIARPRGTTPADFVILSAWDSGLNLRNLAAGSFLTKPISLTNQWDGVSFDRVGPMVLVQSPPAVVSYQVRDIQVWDETL